MRGPVNLRIRGAIEKSGEFTHFSLAESEGTSPEFSELISFRVSLVLSQAYFHNTSARHEAKMKKMLELCRELCVVYSSSLR